MGLTSTDTINSNDCNNNDHNSNDHEWGASDLKEVLVLGLEIPLRTRRLVFVALVLVSVAYHFARPGGRRAVVVLSKAIGDASRES